MYISIVSYKEQQDFSMLLGRAFYFRSDKYNIIRQQKETIIYVRRSLQSTLYAL